MATPTTKAAYIEAVINVYIFGPHIITTDEYEQIEREVMAEYVVNDVTPGTRILARIVLDNAYRYNEAKATNDARRREAMTT